MARKAETPVTAPAQEQPLTPPTANAPVVDQAPVTTEPTTEQQPVTEPQNNQLVTLLAQRFGESYDGMTDDDMVAAIIANAERAAQAEAYQRKIAELEARYQQPQAPSAPQSPAPQSAQNPGIPEWDPNWMFAKTDDDGNILDPSIRQKVENWQIYQRQTLPTVLREWGSLDQRLEQIIDKRLSAMEGKLTNQFTTQTAEGQFYSFMEQTPGMYHADAQGNPLVVNGQYSYTPQGYKLAQYRQQLMDQKVPVAEATRLAIEAFQFSAQPKPMPAFRPQSPAHQAPAARKPFTNHAPSTAHPDIDTRGKTWGELVEMNRARLSG